MVSASDLKPGMALRIGREVYRVLEVEAKTGSAQTGGNVRVHLSNIRSGRLWDQHFRPLERIEEVELERRRLEFLYSDGSNCIFQRLDTYEQVAFPAEALGLGQELLQSGTEVPGEFFEGEPIGVDLPSALDARVVSTAPPVRSEQDSGRKEATLENGMKIQVPLFIAPGEMVSVDLKTGRYVERVRMQHKKFA